MLRLLPFVLLPACSSLDFGANGQEDEDNTPSNYAVIGVSGHCFSLDCEEDLNVEYLAAQGTLDVIGEALATGGGEVESAGVGDEYYSWVYTDSGEAIVYGFVDLVATLQTLRDEWWGPHNRVAVVCHSHGCVWAHTALFVVDDLVVDWLVDLDAESVCWEEDSDCFFAGDDWADVIREDGSAWPWDIGNAANSWDVAGVSTWQDVEDVVPDSVQRNLEVASNDTTFIQDAEPNHYQNGSTASIERFESVENHENSDEPDADGVRWAARRIRDEMAR